MKKATTAAVLAAALAGCASSQANLQRASASQIGGGVRPDDVEVSQVRRYPMSVDWVAETAAGERYECEADDMVRRPYCVKAP